MEPLADRMPPFSHRMPAPEQLTPLATLTLSLTPSVRRDKWNQDLTAGMNVLNELNEPCPEIAKPIIDNAWRLLKELGFPSILSVRTPWPESFANRVPPEWHKPAAIALEILGWHHYRQLEPTRDVAVEFLERAAFLNPADPLTVERFAHATGMLQPDALQAFSDDSKRRETTVAAYRKHAKDAVDAMLLNRFALDDQILSAGDLPEPLEALNQAERKVLLELLHYHADLSSLLASQGDGNASALLKSAYGATQLQLTLLGLGKDELAAIRGLDEILDRKTPSAALGAQLQPVYSTLARLAHFARLRLQPFGDSTYLVRVVKEAQQLLQRIDSFYPDDNQPTRPS